jgi:aryl-alcohol dehydrogenase-like predicted oxidoreductase
MATGNADFLQKPIPNVDKTAYRLGLAVTKGIKARAIEAALAHTPVNYLYWTPYSWKVTPVVRRALARDRDRYILATGPLLGYFGFQVRRFAHRILKALRTDYLDILQIHWLGRMSALNESTEEALLTLVEEGKVRAVGVSIHDRPRAGKLAAESALTHLMIRYNAAHPGAEQDIFPHVDRNKTNICAYTATRWGKLLERPAGWQGELMTAGDCYRFCLSSDDVNVVLTGPKNEQQLHENIAALEKGPLSAEEDKWMREFGASVRASS